MAESSGFAVDFLLTWVPVLLFLLGLALVFTAIDSRWWRDRRIRRANRTPARATRTYIVTVIHPDTTASARDHTDDTT